MESHGLCSKERGTSLGACTSETEAFPGSRKGFVHGRGSSRARTVRLLARHLTKVGPGRILGHRVAAPFIALGGGA
jgi:hypothetical protein